MKVLATTSMLIVAVVASGTTGSFRHLPAIVTPVRVLTVEAQAGLPAPTSSSSTEPKILDDEGRAYVCPMHSDYTSEKPGTCPRCGMNLVLATPFDMRNYLLDFDTNPVAVKAGEKVSLSFRISHPGTHDQIKNFELVHDKPYHLFVISQDMEFFEHIHPEQTADGSWHIETTLPKPGYYKLLSDFLPSGGSSQFVARPLVTAGYSGDLVGDSAHLAPDTVLTKSVDDMRATVTYEPRRFVAGEYGHITYQLVDSATGQPIRDLQTYLGAFGHTLIMSEDMLDYVHSHPLEQLPPNVNMEEVRGGPNVTFEGLMPKPGHYRAWTQFRRNNVVHTFTYTFNVVDLGELR